MTHEVSLETAATAGAALTGVVAYGVFAGADFGGGVWDVVASGKLADRQRHAIAKAMGPVWEANHVWLIFVIVILFTGFPKAYAQLSEGLFLPFHLVLVGIVLRGAAFVFRAHDAKDRADAKAGGGFSRRFSVVFGGASVFTPVLLGMCLGAVSVDLRVFAPVSILMGLFALGICAYLAAVYLTLATEGELREIFRRKALLAGTAVVGLSFVTLPLLKSQAPHLHAGLFSARGAPVLALGVASALLSGACLWRRHLRVARVAAAAQVVFLLGGWGVAQYPYVIYPTLSLNEAAAPSATLVFVLWTLVPGLAIVVPSLLWLFRIFSAVEVDDGKGETTEG